MRTIAAIAIILALGSSAFAQDATQPTPPAPPAPVYAGPQATIETTAGTIVVTLDPVHAPATVANFIKYAREKHFDGTAFYRVVPQSIIQAGSYDASGKFRGGLRKAIPFEGGQPNVTGAIAMAHGDDPNSATAEFFIDLRDVPALDPAPGNTGFAVFGHVTSGMDVANQIAKGQLGGAQGPFSPDATPIAPVTITKVTISQ